MAYIDSITIDNFRSIKHLDISDLSHINLIVGDNNSGKTTLLEAIQLLLVTPNLGGIKSVIAQRTVLSKSGQNFYNSFIKMFKIEPIAI